jgi:hypothetical protein
MNSGCIQRKQGIYIIMLQKLMPPKPSCESAATKASSVILQQYGLVAMESFIFIL